MLLEKTKVIYCISRLRELSVTVVSQAAIHQKYAILDEQSVWYRNIDLPGFDASQESIMQLIGGSVARVLGKQSEEGTEGEAR